MGLSFLIDRERLKIFSEGKIIKQREFAAFVNAESLLDAAHAESQKLMQSAQVEAVRQRELGFQQGWMQAQEKLSVELIRISALRAHALHIERETMARTALAVARQLVDSLDPTLMFDQALRRVSEHVRAERFLSVRVAASDLDSAKRAVQRLMLRCASPRFVDVVVDANLTPASCIIESDMGLVDASLDGFLERLGQALHSVFVDADQRPVGSDQPKGPEASSSAS
jgi:type III secretion protein L